MNEKPDLAGSTASKHIQTHPEERKITSEISLTSHFSLDNNEI